MEVASNSSMTWLIIKSLTLQIMTEDATGKCKGVGFVNYATYDAACVAVASMHGTAVDGGILHVSIQRNK